MDKLKQWQNQIVGLVALAILVAGFVAAPEERLDKVSHALVAFGSTTPGQAVYGALTMLAVAVLRWALARIPSAASLLALALLGSSLVGCGAQLSSTQRTTLATETQRCLLNERAIVDRTGTSAEQDASDLAAERARCDAARAAIVGGGQ